jgi:hypothetical protein
MLTWLVHVRVLESRKTALKSGVEAVNHGVKRALVALVQVLSVVPSGLVVAVPLPPVRKIIVKK